MITSDPTMASHGRAQNFRSKSASDLFVNQNLAVQVAAVSVRKLDDSDYKRRLEMNLKKNLKSQNKNYVKS